MLSYASSDLFAVRIMPACERARDSTLPPGRGLPGRIAPARRRARRVTAPMQRPGLDDLERRLPYRRMQLPLAFLTGPWKLAMGLNALDPADWLWRDEHFAAETAERRHCWRQAPGPGPGRCCPRPSAGRGRAGRPWSTAHLGLAPDHACRPRRPGRAGAGGFLPDAGAGRTAPTR